MTFQSEMQNTQAKRFVELYDIIVGTQEHYYVSGYNKPVTFGTNTYKPAPADHLESKRNDRLESEEMTILLPLDKFTLTFVANAPIEDVLVTIRRYIEETGDFIIIYKGVLVDVELAKQVASCKLEANTDVLTASIPSNIYSASCRWTVFDNNCALAKALFEVSTVVTLLSNGKILQSSAFDAFDDGYFARGHVIFGNDARWITSHTANQITLQVPFDSRLATGGTVQAYPGCSGTRSVCLNTFNNLSRRQAFDHIPSTNPAVFGVK